MNHLDPLFRSPAIDNQFTDRATLQGMLTAMMQEDERGLGGWHAEWETLPDIVQLTAGAIHQLATIAPDLEVDMQRMRKNLGQTQGLIFAEAVNIELGEKIGRAQSHEIVEAACGRARKENRDLRTILSADPKVGAQLRPMIWIACSILAIIWERRKNMSTE